MAVLTDRQATSFDLCAAVSAGAVVNNMLCYEMSLLLAVDQTFGLRSKIIIPPISCL